MLVLHVQMLSSELPARRKRDSAQASRGDLRGAGAGAHPCRSTPGRRGRGSASRRSLRSRRPPPRASSTPWPKARRGRSLTGTAPAASGTACGSSCRPSRRSACRRSATSRRCCRSASCRRASRCGPAGPAARASGAPSHCTAPRRRASQGARGSAIVVRARQGVPGWGALPAPWAQRCQVTGCAVARLGRLRWRLRAVGHNLARVRGARLYIACAMLDSGQGFAAKSESFAVHTSPLARLLSWCTQCTRV
jgi:hypothetical protein